MPWWATLLIVFGSLALLAFCIWLIVMVTQKSPNALAPFPPDEDGVFKIQVRNSTPKEIKVYLDDTPMCSKEAKNDAHPCPRGAPEKDNARSPGWDNDVGVMAIVNKQRKTVMVPKQRFVVLQPDEVWQIEPPRDANNKPYWCFSEPPPRDASNKPYSEARICPGVGMYVTRPEIDMPAAGKVTRFEFNINNGALWFNAGAVDGSNTKFTMRYTGTCDDALRVGNVPLGLKTSQNPNGCPVVDKHSCVAPQFWPNLETDCKMDLSAIVDFSCDTSEPPSVRMLAGCPWPSNKKDDLCKKAWCHKWWSTNPCAQQWIRYIQQNPSGQKMDAYAWAYDEKRWKPGDEFDLDFNPPDNSAVRPLAHCALENGSLNIDILDVM